MFDWDFGTLSANQQRIADYVIKHPERIAYMTEQNIADDLGLSIASVSRFWRAVGFKNIKHFKETLRDRQEGSPANKFANTMRKVGTKAGYEGLLEQSLAFIRNTADHVDPEKLEAASLRLAEARRVYVYAPGPSEGLASLLAFRLSRFGIDVRILEKGGSELHEALVHVMENDVIVLFGFIRLLPEAKVLLDYASSIGCGTLLITDRLASDFLSSADITLYADRGEAWEFHSMTGPTYLVESLILAVGIRGREAALERLDRLSNLRKKYSAQLPR